MSASADQWLIWAGAVVLGLGVLVAIGVLIWLLTKGETIEVESRWSGLGGGLGGWRMSTAASAAMIAAGLVAALLGFLVHYVPVPSLAAAAPPASAAVAPGAPTPAPAKPKT